MRKSIVLLSALIMLGGSMGYSQSRSAGFNAFRKKALSNYQDFRERILEHYADFLNGEWHEFEAIMEEESPYTEPKPKTLPVYEAQLDTMVTNTMIPLPEPMNSDKFTSSDILDKAIKGALKKKRFTPSDAEGKSNYERAAMRIPDPDFAFGPFPGQIEAPRPEVAGMSNTDGNKAPTTDSFHFDFYGMDAFIPEVDFTIADIVPSIEDTGKHWQNMAQQKGSIETARQLFGLAQQLGLNGYLTLRLTESYVNQKFRNSDQKARMSAIHYLMSNMGYDIRLAHLGDIFTVMMPFDQNKVFGLVNYTLDGRRYTMIMPEGMETPKTVSFYTCQLPTGELGKTSDLRLTGLNLPMMEKPFEVTKNGITIKGIVNDNIRKLLHRYPQMPTGDFASSWIDKQLRDDIVKQVKAQVEGMSETQAVNTLMSFCHYGFDYSTDQDYHGFEKPYFLEENLIYDKNDCEDRAIFFSYLVWNALGIPCQLLQYPGHESVSTAVDSAIDGFYYDTEGSKYYSSDPTYCGSRIGQIMNRYRNTAPVIDKQYH